MSFQWGFLVLFVLFVQPTFSLEKDENLLKNAINAAAEEQSDFFNETDKQIASTPQKKETRALSSEAEKKPLDKKAKKSTIKRVIDFGDLLLNLSFRKKEDTPKEYVQKKNQKKDASSLSLTIQRKPSSHKKKNRRKSKKVKK